MPSITEAVAIEEIRAALQAESALMRELDFNGGALPEGFQETVAQRAGFYPTNEQRSALEVFDFQRDKPARYFAYRDRDFRTLTTWTGDKLASVLSTGDVYRSNFGDRRQSFRALGINGVTYSGTTYIDSGDYVRMRAVRS